MTSIRTNDGHEADDGGRTWIVPRSDDLQEYVPAGIDTTIAHTARIYDFLLGGKNNFAVDRAAAAQIVAAVPDLATTLRLNRVFLRRAVRYATRRGIRQFLDIGTGIPSSGNTHESAHEIAPDARVAYVDNDPIVLVHARALMADNGPGTTTFTQADLRDPAAILAAPEIRKVIDLGEPVALMLVAILHFIKDEENPYAIVAHLRDALPSGSMLLLSHATGDADPARGRAAADGYRNASAQMSLRTHAEIVRLFEGFDLVEPGVSHHWNPDDEPAHELDALQAAWGYMGVGIKP